MHKVEIVSLKDSNISYEIFVHPYLITKGSHYNNGKKIWSYGKSMSENINGQEVNLVEIPAEILNILNGNENYEIEMISLNFEYNSSKHDKYTGRNPIDFIIYRRNKSTEEFIWDFYILLDYNISKWYMNLLHENQQLKEKNQKLEQELLHEKYRPGGSGYEKAKEDFDERKN